MQLLIVFHDQLHTSGIRDADTDTRIFHCTADSDRFPLCQSSLIILPNRLQCLNKTGRLIYDLTVRKHFSRTYRITVTNFPRCDSHSICHHIQKCFCCKTGLGDTKSTKSTRRRIICIIGSPFNFEILIMIWSCRMRAGTFEHRSAKRCICSGIRNYSSFYSHNISMFITSHCHIHIERMTFRMHQKGLCPGQFYFDRFFSHISKKCCQMLNRHIFFSTESASDQCILHFYFICSKYKGTFMQCLVCRLVCRINKYIPILIIKCNRAFRFQKSMFRPRCLKVMRDHIFGILNCFFCVSTADMFMRADIVFLFVKHLVCVRCSCLFNRVYRWQYFVFYFYQFLCFFRCFSVLRGNQRDRISQIMCKSSDRYQGILVMFQMANLVFSRYIPGSHNCFYTLKCSGFGRID